MGAGGFEDDEYWDVDDDFYEDDECKGCGRLPEDDGCCPMCCNNGGVYQPGTEECDFCFHYKECSGLSAKQGVQERRATPQVCQECKDEFGHPDNCIGCPEKPPAP